MKLTLSRILVWYSVKKKQKKKQESKEYLDLDEVQQDVTEG